MGIYDGMLPEHPIKGKRGYYPVTSAEEWEALPNVYKAMEWLPVTVYNSVWKKKEITVAEYVEFDVIYLEPYKIHAKVTVHVQEVQKILFCLFNNPECHLYSVCGVIFQNGERYGAKWVQDTTSGAFAIMAGSHKVGIQGGFRGFVPNKMIKDSDGSFRMNYHTEGNRCHYQLMNPFR